MRLPVFLATLVVVAGGVPMTEGGVVPASQSIGGKTQLQLAEQWLAEMFLTPSPSVSPLLDDTGAAAGIGERENVFLLSGYRFRTPVTRVVDVPAGKPLFFPIITLGGDNTSGFGSPPTSFTASKLLGFLDPIIRPSAVSLFASVDGEDLPNLYSHRQTTDPDHHTPTERWR